MSYFAHVRPLPSGGWDEPQPLIEHLSNTATLARDFAADFDSGQWAYLLGTAHDLGKGREEWQRYLRGSSGYNEEASSENENTSHKCEHAIQGAIAVDELLKPFGRFLAYCIAGHHTGLPDWCREGPHAQSAMEFRLAQQKKRVIENRAFDIDDAFQKNFPSIKSLLPMSLPWKFERNDLDLSLWIRMLFSCLIDADRLDTERYMNPETFAQRGAYPALQELQEIFTEYMKTKTASPGANHAVYEARQTVLKNCLDAAEKEPGFFSLTVPTGGGKTLSSMAFALAHALKYGKKRVIYVIPYTSIIEQNADVFREVFEKDGDDAVLEHHSNLDENEQTVRSRLAAENWDAPIIVTTTVQFFESLFSAKTSRCRKLHNIANSVVIFDEAQLIPPEHIKPILETLRLLTAHYRVSAVFCTATQPVFEKQEKFPEFPGLARGSIREIVTDVTALHNTMQRVAFTPPEEAAKDFETLAQELSAYPRVLCIVSDRKSCRELHALMPSGTYHLSALMCAQHRSDVIAEIKEKLRTDGEVRVISTQLVEAGVDIDFPVVYRAMAGFDSLAQAAGRCNREGLLDGALGKLVVFNSERRPPVGTLRKAADTAAGLLRQGLSPLDHTSYNLYFSGFYWRLNDLDKFKMMELLAKDAGSRAFQFRTAGELFHLIDDSNQRTIIVPYKEGANILELLKKRKISDSLGLRKLQRYTINIYMNQFDELQRRGSLEEVLPGVFALNNPVEYDLCRGLLIDEPLTDNAMFIV